MAPLIVQAIAWLGFRIAGRLGGWSARTEPLDFLRLSLAVMFVFTGSAHFVSTTRRDFIGMVPPWLPSRGTMVSFTGLLQIAGALGLLTSPWVRPSAVCLAALLVAMAPANLRAAGEGLDVAGRRGMSLWLRLPLPLFWIGCLCAVAAFWNVGAGGH